MGVTSSSSSLPEYEWEPELPKFSLDLDLDPKSRWSEITQAFRPRFQKLMVENAEVMEGFDALGHLTPLVSRTLPAGQRLEVEALSELLGAPTPSCCRNFLTSSHVS